MSDPIETAAQASGGLSGGNRKFWDPEYVGIEHVGATMAVLVVGCIYAAWRQHRNMQRMMKEHNVSGEFMQFQSNYLRVYLICTFSDWLKGPYVYALYEEYGFTTIQIAWLFVGGFFSSLVFGTIVGSLSDKLGRRYVCLVFCGVYALSALTKIVNSFAVLFFGRVLSGIATSLLFTSFESWMVSEHRSRGFPEHLLTNTFSKATLGNGIVAILAGFVAQAAAMCCGYAAPFLVAIPCLSVASLMIYRWPENYGNAHVHPLETLSRGFWAIARDPKLRYLGSCQALFEGCMYVWVFYWTPSVATEATKSKVPYGLAFACYMAGLMIGGTMPEFFPLNSIPVPLHATAMLSMVFAAVFFNSKVVVFLSFVLFESCVGVYFPTHGTLRSIHIDEATRSSVMNFFRVPLNIFVVTVLHMEMEPQRVMAFMALTHATALVAYKLFARIADERTG